MVDRRRFTFGGLLLAVAPVAHADPAPPQMAPQTPPPPPHRFDAVYALAHQDGQLAVTLAVVNLEPEPVSLLVRMGTRLGPRLRVTVDGVELDQPEAAATAFSRLGPIPSYEVIAASGAPGEELSIGTYRFRCPARPASVELRLWVATDLGTVELPPRRLSLEPKAA
ncbi:MAG: hypothetical protein ABMA64_06515 [Myxococcota bacterium]